MRRLASSLGILTLLIASVASAQTIYSSAGKVITYYVPHSAPNCQNSIEGCIATSKPGLNGKREPACLDAVRLGKAKYVTLASAESNYGKYYNLGTITYLSALDNQKHTVENVIGYVHDTGCAFNGTCKTGNFSKVPRPDKIDVCTTLCPTCNDAQAGAYAQGKNVALVPSGGGITDPMLLTPNYGNPSSLFSSPMGMSPYSSVGAFSSQAPAMPSAAAPAQYGTSGSAPASPLSISPAPISNLLANTPTQTAISLFTSGPSAGSIFAQPRNPTFGSSVLVSWTSVNMKVDSCKVFVNGAPFAEGAEGSKRLSIPNSSGTIMLSLECIAGNGSAQTTNYSITPR